MCITQSEQIDQIAIALAEAQKEMAPAGKNSMAPVGKEGSQKIRKYADLAAVFDVLRDVLPKNGLAVTQAILPNNEGKAHVRTTLLHKSGQWIASECIMPCDRQGGIQGLGSAISYARRYSLSALVGVVSDDDDDGQVAQGSGQNQAFRQGQQRQTQPPRQGAGNTSQHQEVPANVGRISTPQTNQQQPHSQAQHISLEDACWEFMQCNSVPTLKARAEKLQICSDNPNYNAIHEAYRARLHDLMGASSQNTPTKGDIPHVITPAQRTAIMAHYGKRGMASDDKRDARLADLSSFCSRPIASVNDLTFDEASDFIKATNENREAA